MTIDEFRSFVTECEGLFLLAVGLNRCDPKAKGRWLRAEVKRGRKNLNRLLFSGIPAREPPTTTISTLEGWRIPDDAPEPASQSWPPPRWEKRRTLLAGKDACRLERRQRPSSDEGHVPAVRDVRSQDARPGQGCCVTACGYDYMPHGYDRQCNCHDCREVRLAERAAHADPVADHCDTCNGVLFISEGHVKCRHQCTDVPLATYRNH